MDVYEIIDALKDHINSFKSVPEGDEDPEQLYFAFDDLDNEAAYLEKLTASTPVPVVLLDTATEGTQLIAGGEGLIQAQNHFISLIILANATDRDKATARAEAITLRDTILGKIESIDDCRFRIFPVRQTYPEFFVGSVKCTGVEITIKIEV